MGRKPFECPITEDLCADGRCSSARCFRRETEIAERSRLDAEHAAAEENEVRKEAEKFVREWLKARKDKDKLYQSTVLVSKLAKKPKAIAEGRRRRAAVLAAAKTLLNGT